MWMHSFRKCNFFLDPEIFGSKRFLKKKSRLSTPPSSTIKGLWQKSNVVLSNGHCIVIRHWIEYVPGHLLLFLTSVIRAYFFLINSQSSNIDNNEPIQGLSQIEDLLFTKPNYSKIWKDPSRPWLWKCFPVLVKKCHERPFDSVIFRREY